MKYEKTTIKVTFEVDVLEQLSPRAWNRIIKLIAKDRCEFCRGTRNLHAHHMDQDRSNNCIANGMCLCASCHRSLHVAINKENDTEATSISDLFT